MNTLTKKILHLEEKGQAKGKAKSPQHQTRYLCGGLPEYYLTTTPLEQLLLNPLGCATNAA